MGGCLSLVLRKATTKQPPPPTAKVVSANGDLHEYTVPVFVCDVLQAESPSTTSFFLCNSDSLYFNDVIPAMKSDEELLPDQIYFLLPDSKMEQRLSATDMAALAVKASLALESFSALKNKHRGPFSKHRRNIQISPLLSESNQKSFDNDVEIGGFQKNSEPKISRSGSVRKLQRYTSRRAKMAVRSFGLGLSTIYEGTVL